MRRGCPLLDKLCSAAIAVTFLACSRKPHDETSWYSFLYNHTIAVSLKLQRVERERGLDVCTFAVLVVPFAPLTSVFGAFAPRRQVCLCRGFFTSLKGLCDCGRINGIRNTAKASLWFLVKLLRPRLGFVKSRGWRRRVLQLCFRRGMLCYIVCVRGVQSSSRSKDVKRRIWAEIKMCNW